MKETLIAYNGNSGRRGSAESAAKKTISAYSPSDLVSAKDIYSVTEQLLKDPKLFKKYPETIVTAGGDGTFFTLVSKLNNPDKQPKVIPAAFGRKNIAANMLGFGRKRFESDEVYLQRIINDIPYFEEKRLQSGVNTIDGEIQYPFFWMNTASLFTPYGVTHGILSGVEKNRNSHTGIRRDMAAIIFAINNVDINRERLGVTTKNGRSYQQIEAIEASVIKKPFNRWADFPVTNNERTNSDNLLLIAPDKPFITKSELIAGIGIDYLMSRILRRTTSTTDTLVVKALNKDETVIFENRTEKPNQQHRLIIDSEIIEIPEWEKMEIAPRGGKEIIVYRRR